MSDPIADMLTRIRNAQLARKKQVSIPNSKIKLSITKVLLEEGYISSFRINDESRISIIDIDLKYYAGMPVIEKIERISKPGLRVYHTSKLLPSVLNGLGTAIISTSKGVMTERQAKARGIGGEILCTVV